MRIAIVLSVLGSFVLGAVLVARALDQPDGQRRVIRGVGSLYYHLDEEYRVADAEFDGTPATVQVSDIGPIPADAVAVAYKIAAIDPAVYGHVTFAPGTSVLNFFADETTTNAGITQVQARNLLVAASSRVRLTIDIVGYFRAAE